MDGVLFNRSTNTLIQCPGGKAGHYTTPSSVNTIWTNAFAYCASLSGVTIGTNVSNIGDYAFAGCTSLTNVTICANVTSIGVGVFDSCTSLTTVTMPKTVSYVGDWAFAYCSSLTGVYFQGSAPDVGSDVFDYDDIVIVYCLPGTTGWEDFVQLTGLPTALWPPQVRSDSSFGVRTNRFGFNIDWSSDMVVVVEACTNLANPAWTPLRTNMLSGGWVYFSDPDWTNYPGRFYRLRSP